MTENILLLNQVQVHRCSLYYYYVNNIIASYKFLLYVYSHFVSSKGVCVRERSQDSVCSVTPGERPGCMAAEEYLSQPGGGSRCGRRLPNCKLRSELWIGVSRPGAGRESPRQKEYHVQRPRGHLADRWNSSLSGFTFFYPSLPDLKQAHVCTHTHKSLHMYGQANSQRSIKKKHEFNLSIFLLPTSSPFFLPHTQTHRHHAQSMHKPFL